MPSPRNCWVRLSCALYGWIVRVYPCEFREEFGAQMRETFSDRARVEHQKRGALGLMGLWMNTLMDSASSLFREHKDKRSGTMSEIQVKKSWGSYQLWERNTYWSGMVMGALFCAQALCGAGLIYFGYTCGEKEYIAQLMGWWLIAFLPIQLFFIARDLKKKQKPTAA